MIYFHPKPTGGCVITMSEQGRADQESGAGPVDPNTPASVLGGPEPREQGEAQPKSPDEEPQRRGARGRQPTTPRGRSRKTRTRTTSLNRPLHPVKSDTVNSLTVRWM